MNYIIIKVKLKVFDNKNVMCYYDGVINDLLAKVVNGYCLLILNQ